MIDPITKKQAIEVKPKEGDWIIFDKFNGFKNRKDETQSRGAFVVGQNITFSGSDLPQIRPGTELLGTSLGVTSPVKRAVTFKTRDGDTFELKVLANSKIYYWLVGTSTDYSLLMELTTDDLDVDFCVIDGTADATNFCFFCNGTDDWYQFNGAYATIASGTVNTITKTGSKTWAAAGFATTGSVVIDGVAYSYTGGTDTTTLTGVGTDASGLTNGSVGVQLPTVVSALSSVKSSVMMAHEGRIHARLETKKNIWNYSKLDDPDDFTTGSTDNSGGSKPINGGGGIKAFVNFFGSILAGTETTIRQLKFTQSGDRVDVPFYSSITPSDYASLSLGFTNRKGVCSSPYGAIFVAPDKRLILLTGNTSNENPDYLVLSEPVQATFDEGNFDDCVVSYNEDMVYISFKSSNDVTANDTLMKLNLVKGPSGLTFRWDAPYVGLSVNDITFITNTDNKTEVHFHSSLNADTFKLTTEFLTDDKGVFIATLRTWAENFGYPVYWKTLDEWFVEVKMTESSQMTASLLFDRNGSSGIQTYTYLGTETEYREDAPVYNPFGASKFGSEKFGTSPENEELYLYRFFSKLNKAIKFYNLSVQFSNDIEFPNEKTSMEATNFEIVRFGFRIKDIIKETPTKFLHS